MMVKSFFDGNIGLLATNKQFVMVVRNEILGPYKNKDWKKVYKIIEGGKLNDTN